MSTGGSSFHSASSKAKRRWLFSLWNVQTHISFDCPCSKTVPSNRKTPLPTTLIIDPFRNIRPSVKLWNILLPITARKTGVNIDNLEAHDRLQFVVYHSQGTDVVNQGKVLFNVSLHFNVLGRCAKILLHRERQFIFGNSKNNAAQNKQKGLQCSGFVDEYLRLLRHFGHTQESTGITTIYVTLKFPSPENTNSKVRQWNAAWFAILSRCLFHPLHVPSISAFHTKTQTSFVMSWNEACQITKNIVSRVLICSRNSLPANAIVQSRRLISAG